MKELIGNICFGIILLLLLLILKIVAKILEILIKSTFPIILNFANQIYSCHSYAK